MRSIHQFCNHCSAPIHVRVSSRDLASFQDLFIGIDDLISCLHTQSLGLRTHDKHEMARHNHHPENSLSHLNVVISIAEDKTFGAKRFERLVNPHSQPAPRDLPTRDHV